MKLWEAFIYTFMILQIRNSPQVGKAAILAPVDRQESRYRLPISVLSPARIVNQGGGVEFVGRNPSSINANNNNHLSRASKRLPGLARSLGIEMANSELQPGYVCAPHCTCSLVLVEEGGGRVGGRRQNLSSARCESSLFNDVLSIDKRTHIIHISLPIERNTTDPTATSDPFELSKSDSDQSGQQNDNQPAAFRMPRLVRFNQLREIVLDNLKLEACESEVFKRGQRLKRLRLNRNQLVRISKACLKHLDRLVELNLDYNLLEELESALFNGLLKLRSLSIAHNKLSELAAHQFANLTNLRALNLAGNHFTSLNLHLFEPMSGSLQLLTLAKNRIKSFSHTMASIVPLGLANVSMNTSSVASNPQMGVFFRNLIKLNVDDNKVERIKLLQLHRFYNVKLLSIRRNLIGTIRDKAFNGFKLIELNLSQNKLESIWRCAFCNSTIKRLVLSHNNISLPRSSLLLSDQQVTFGAPNSLNHPSSSGGTTINDHNNNNNHTSNSRNMLILSQSIFGPLFGNLEYLDLSGNSQLADQLDVLIEPLMRLEYLNLAAVGFERSLAEPNLFKNLHRLRYLNLSHNELDQLVIESIEPLGQLEVLDISHNKFNELDESFLVGLDELPNLKLVQLSSNPWFCSQCKVAPLYDWVLRSPIYNASCISPISMVAQQSESEQQASDRVVPRVDSQEFRPYDILFDPIGYEPGGNDVSVLNFDLDGSSSIDDLLSNNYNLLAGQNGTQPAPSDIWSFGMADDEDDTSIGNILALTRAASDYLVLEATGSESELSIVRKQLHLGERYCLRCEFPVELRSFQLHELSAGDFKFCHGAAPRFSASEPKIGLTLALVVIGSLFVIIVIVIVMYRKKGANQANAYYPDESTDSNQLERGGGSRGTGGGRGGRNQPVLSVSSDADQQFADATDYSSPPMSQSGGDNSLDQDEILEEDEDEEEEDDEEEDEEFEGEEEEEEIDEEDEEGEFMDDYEDGNNDQGEDDKGGGDNHDQSASSPKGSSGRKREEEYSGNQSGDGSSSKQGKSSPNREDSRQRSHTDSLGRLTAGGTPAKSTPSIEPSSPESKKTPSTGLSRNSKGAPRQASLQSSSQTSSGSRSRRLPSGSRSLWARSGEVSGPGSSLFDGSQSRLPTDEQSETGNEPTKAAKLTQSSVGSQVHLHQSQHQQLQPGKKAGGMPDLNQHRLSLAGANQVARVTVNRPSQRRRRSSRLKPETASKATADQLAISHPPPPSPFLGTSISATQTSGGESLAINEAMRDYLATAASIERRDRDAATSMMVDRMAERGRDLEQGDLMERLVRTRRRVELDNEDEGESDRDDEHSGIVGGGQLDGVHLDEDEDDDDLESDLEDEDDQPTGRTELRILRNHETANQNPDRLMVGVADRKRRNRLALTAVGSSERATEMRRRLTGDSFVSSHSALTQTSCHQEDLGEL